MRKLSNWIESYVYYNHESEAPDPFLRWTAISMVAAALEKRVWLRWGYEKIYPPLYIILVAPPGKARKGTAMHLASELVEECSEITKMHTSTTSAQFIRRMVQSGKSFVVDGIEYVHMPVYSFTEELTDLFKDDLLYKNLISFWDGRDKWDSATKGDRSKGVKDEIKGCCVNLLSATTPGSLKDSLPSDGISSGFTSRVIFVGQVRSRGRKPDALFPFTPEAIEIRKGLLHDLNLITKMVGIYHRTDEYLEKYTDWYLNMPEECPFMPERFNPYWSRRATIIKKLSMIWAASESDELIAKPHHFDLALMHLEEAEKMMPIAFNKMGNNTNRENLDIVCDKIFFATKNPITGGIFDSELIKETCFEMDLSTMESMLLTLKRAGMIKEEIRNGRKFYYYIEQKKE